MTRGGRILAVLGLLGAIMGGGGPAVYAATSASAGTVGMEMLVMLPQKTDVAVYQQIVLKPSGTTATIGVIPHAQGIVALGTTLVGRVPEGVVVRATTDKFALRYTVPWNGHSASLPVPAYLKTDALVFLVPADLQVPVVLNPTLAPAGKGKIPGIPNSPVFQELATTNVAPGQTVPIVIEAAGTDAASARQTLLGTRGGTYPVLGALFQALVVLVGLGAVALALNWRAARPDVGRRIQRDRLVDELAVWDASFRRGELEESVYRAHRQELVEALTPVWEEGAGDR